MPRAASKARQALEGQGFDVACGFQHLDTPHRGSVAYDLMECERGTVDRIVLDLMADIKLTAGDLVRVSDGSCRLRPQLARAIVATCRVPQERIAELAKWLGSIVNGGA